MNISTPRAVLLVLLVIAFGRPATLLADSVKHGVNHASDGDMTDEITVLPGDTVEFSITDTCPKFFNYKVRALEQRADDVNAERVMDCNLLQWLQI